MPKLTGTGSEVNHALLDNDDKAGVEVGPDLF